MRPSLVLPVFSVALLAPLAACGAPPQATAIEADVGLAASDGADGDGDIDVADAATEGWGAPPPPLPTSVPDGRFDPATALASADGSVVAWLDAGRLSARSNGGEPVPGAALPGSSELRALSADGSDAAVLTPGADGAWVITVVAVPTDGPASRPLTDGPEPTAGRTYHFDRLVEPEAFSTDGALLFVVDHGAGSQPGTYRIRPLDLATGELADALGPDKVPLAEDMWGRGTRQQRSPDRTRLYTLYLRQPAHGGQDHGGQDHGGSPGEAVVGFVHVLDLAQEWAFCLELPVGFGTGEAGSGALALSPDGATLAVLDTVVGQVALASTVDLAITATVDLPPLALLDQPGDDPVHLGLTNDAVAVGRGNRLAWLDRASMSPLGDGVEVLRAPVGAMTPAEDQVLVWPVNGFEPFTVAPPPVG